LLYGSNTKQAVEKKKGKMRNKRINCEGKGAKGRGVQNAGGWPGVAHKGQEPTKAANGQHPLAENQTEIQTETVIEMEMETETGTQSLNPSAIRLDSAKS